jgi:hypothetical protein
MGYLSELVSLANELDLKGLTKEAGILDELISKASEGYDPWEEGPSDEELRSMELGILDPVEEDRKKGLYERLNHLNTELSMFGAAISDGKMQDADWNSFMDIKAELAELLKEMEEEDEAPLEDALI